MTARILADLVLVLHVGFVLFVVGGGLLVLRRRRWAWIHLPAAVWGALIEFFGWTCPLTPLERRLRRAAGGVGPERGFIEHYGELLLYPGWLTREVQIALGLAVVLINGAIYGWVAWHRWGRGEERGS